MSGAARRRLRVLSGGPTSAEAAAVLLALDAAGVQGDDAPVALSRWRRAARLESLGLGQLASPAQVRDGARDVS